MPQHEIVVMDEPDQPNPRLTRTVSSGFIRGNPSKTFDIEFLALNVNIVVEAAGPSIMKILFGTRF